MAKKARTPHPPITDLSALPALIGVLFQTVKQLNTLYGRPFTPDGHLVGSIGEVVAAYTYDLTLEDCSNQAFDAKTKDGRTVEIKLTSGKRVAVASDGEPPNILIVLKLDSAIGFTEAYNGAFPLELWGRKTTNKRRTKIFGLAELRKNPALLDQVNSLTALNALFRI